MVSIVFKCAVFLLVLVGAGCADVPATNPFDPMTPSAQQAPGWVIGKLILPDTFTEERLSDSWIELHSATAPAEVAYQAQPAIDGAFLFNDVKAGAYTVEFRVLGFAAERIAIKVDIGAYVALGDITLSVGEMGSIEGDVVLAGASAGDRGGVRVEVADSPFVTFTSTEGRYRLQVNAGSHRVLFSADGYVSAPPLEVRVEPDATTSVPTQTLEPLSGQITVGLELSPAWIPEAERYARIRLSGGTSELAADGVQAGTEHTFGSVPGGDFIVRVERAGFAGDPIGPVTISAETPTVNVGLLTARLVDLRTARLNLAGVVIDACSLRQLPAIEARGADLSAVRLTGDFGSADGCEGEVFDGPLDLSGADLTGADLTGCTLANARIENANFTGANLDGVDLSGARARGASFTGASLSGASLSGADLRDTDFVGTDLSGARFARVGDPTGEGPWPTLGEPDEAWSFFPCAGNEASALAGSTLARADLSGASLAGIDLRGVEVHGANLSQADLRFACLQSAVLSQLNLSGAVLDGADAAWADLEAAVLNGTSLRGVRLSGASLSSALLEDAHFAPLPDAQCAELPAWAEYDDAGECADLEDAPERCRCRPLLDDASMVGAQITGTIFDGADLENVDLVGARMAASSGIATERPSLCQPEAYQACLDAFRCLAEDLVGGQANFGARFSDWAERCSADPSVVYRADEINRSFVNPPERLECLLAAHAAGGCSDVNVAQCIVDPGGSPHPDWAAACDWTDIRRTGDAVAACDGDVHPPCTTTPVVFRDARLDGANLSDGTLSGVEWQGTSLRNVRMRNVQSFDSLFQGCDLAGAELAESRLTGTRFVDVDLTDADFTGAVAREIDFSTSQLPGVVFTRTDLRGTAFEFEATPRNETPGTMREANLGGARIRNVRWLGLDMRGVDLSRALLRDVSLDGALLSDARIDNADLGGELEQGLLGPVSLQGADLDNAMISNTVFVADATGASFANAEFDRVQLTNLDLTATFANAGLQGAYMNDVRSEQASGPRGEVLGAVDFSGANLEGALIENSRLRSADFSDADLRGASLLNSDLSQMVVSRACFEDGGGFNDLNPNDDSTRFDGSILHNVDFSSIDMAGVSFVDADVSGAFFTTACSIEEASFVRAVVQGTRFCSTAFLNGSGSIGAAVPSRFCNANDNCRCAL